MNKSFDIEKINNFNSKTMVGYIGIEILEANKDYVSGRMPVDERTIQPYGLLHGGASVALAETLGSIGGNIKVYKQNKTVVGVEINANHPMIIKLSNSLTKVDHKKLSNLLLDQANILDGNILSNPADYIETLTELFIKN